MNFKTCTDVPALQAGMDGTIRILATGETLPPYIHHVRSGRSFLAVDFDGLRLPVAQLVVSAFAPDKYGHIGHFDKKRENCSAANLGVYKAAPPSISDWSVNRQQGRNRVFEQIGPRAPMVSERTPMVFRGGVPLAYLPAD